MVPISTSQREAANRLRSTYADVPQEAHWHTCPVCGQRVDRRRLGDVIYHEAPEHPPLAQAGA